MVDAESTHFIDLVNVWATQGRPVQIIVATTAWLLVVMLVNSGFCQVIYLNNQYSQEADSRKMIFAKHFE